MHRFRLMAMMAIIAVIAAGCIFPGGAMYRAEEGGRLYVIKDSTATELATAAARQSLAVGRDARHAKEVDTSAAADQSNAAQGDVDEADTAKSDDDSMRIVPLP